MKIIIDIDDNLYTRLFDDEDINAMDMFKGCVAIRKGTPLPKNHGRLKDIDKIINDGISKGFCDWYDEMKYAETIIEADKENEEL